MTMIEVTTTQLARQLRQMLDSVEFKGQEIIVVRNRQKIARILPGQPHMTALEALSDLYRTLPANVANDRTTRRKRGGHGKSRSGTSGKALNAKLASLKNPWDT